MLPAWLSRPRILLVAALVLGVLALIRLVVLAGTGLELSLGRLILEVPRLALAFVVITAGGVFDGLLELFYSLPEGTGDFRQPCSPKHQESHNEDDHDFLYTDTAKHGEASSF